MLQNKADFRKGSIWETDYPAEQFDLVVSMDTDVFEQRMARYIYIAKKQII